VIQQKRKIEKLEVEYIMLQQLVINLVRCSQSIFSHKRMSGGSTYEGTKEEESIQQVHGDVEMEFMDLEIRPPFVE
jgi:hypothetical protein